mgnify:FL=1
MNKNIYKKKNLFFLTILSVLFTILFFNDQVAVNGGLVISGEVFYQDNLSPLKYYFFNSWTLLTQFSALLFKIGLNSKSISFCLIFLLNLILFSSCFIIFERFIKNTTLSIILSCLLIFFQKNLGDTDYPSLIFTIHTFGAFAQALTGLIIASLLVNNLKLSFSLGFILFCIHPIVGLWVIVILIFFTFFQKKINNFNSFLKILLPGLLLTIVSLSIFYYFSVEKLTYDQNLFNIYIEKWDGHRAITGEIHYEYLIKSLILLVIIFYLCPKNNENKFFSSVFSSMIISSIIIYLLFKIFNLNNYQILAPIIPGRFMITYTFIAWPVALSLIYYRLKDKKYTNYFFYSLIILYSSMHYKTFLNVNDKLVSKNDNLVYLKLKSLKNTGNVITSADTSFNVLYISKKPLLMSKTLDYLPYHPYLVNKIENIMTEVYGYDFQKPPKNNYPYLSDVFIKSKFEKRSLNDWVEIKNKFKTNLILTPIDWKLNLKLIYSDDKYNLYSII